MRLILITSLVMLAFAANSVLNRVALVDDVTGPAAFALLRLVSGAIVLIVLASARSAGFSLRGHFHLWGALSLAAYVLGFSFAYVTLDAGTGALLMFGGVQITMFIGALMQGEDIPQMRWVGAVVAFFGLVVLLWPQGDVAADLAGTALMALAALGWGVYSLLGRGAVDPLATTAGNFVFAGIVAVVCFALLPDGLTARGAMLAIVSGAITSGAGYAVWYSILPQLGATRAAVAQLTVPVLAAIGGLLLLDENLSLRFIAATALVMAGVGWSLAAYKTRRSNGS